MPYERSLDDLRIHCGLITLRPPRADDIDALMDVYDDDFNLVPQPRPGTDASTARRGILNRIARNPHARSDEPWGLDLIVESASDVVIGWASLEPDSDLPGRQLETTTWVAPQFRRRGHATTIRYGLLALAFDGLKATYALSRAQPVNEGSNRISNSLGYTQGGRPSYTSTFIPYQNWSLSRMTWAQADRPVDAKLVGHAGFRDWLDQH